jgi:hypothetical protein
VPGEEVAPSDFANMIVESIEFDGPESSAGKAIQFNHGYSIYTDNVDNGGGSGTRLWVDMPDNADVVIGPRAGAAAIAGMRIRTDATTASAANMFINSSTYAIARSTSSRKYKQDIVPAEVDEAAFLSMRPVHYRGRSEVEARERYEEQVASGRDMRDLDHPPVPRTHLGFIAEEVHELGLVDFVVYDDATGEPDALAYDRMIVAAVQVIRRQAERVATLEGQLASLAERVEALHDIEQQRKG